MDSNEKFINFLDSLRTPENAPLIEAVASGFLAITESMTAIYNAIPFTKMSKENRKQTIQSLTNQSLRNCIRNATAAMMVGKNTKYNQEEIEMCQDELDLRELTGGRQSWTGASGKPVWMGPEGRRLTVDDSGKVIEAPR
jgi:hypothetical protein